MGCGASTQSERTIVVNKVSQFHHSIRWKAVSPNEPINLTYYSVRSVGT